MIRYLRQLFIFLLFILLKSCSIDEDPNSIYSDTVNLDIKLNALHSNVGIRVIITDAENETVLLNASGLDLSVPYRPKVKTGSLNIYIIGNEPDQLTAALDKIRHESQILPLTLSRNDIPSGEIPPGSEEESNLPLFKKIAVLVKAENHDPETGMVSIDNGATWSQALDVELDRLAVKVNLKMRKYTTPETDQVTVKKVGIKNIPTHSYWYPGRPYMNSSFLPPEFPYDDATGITFTENADKNQDDNFMPIFEGYVIPEYIAADPTDENTAIALEIYATYNSDQNIYHIPLKTSPTASTYSLERNSEHTIKVTITDRGGAIISPEIEYEVSEWNDAGNGVEVGRAITYDARWNDGTLREEKNIFLTEDKSVEFKFKLVHPIGSTWKATLSNPLYFEFDYENGAVSAGLGGSDTERTIRIKPRKGVSTNGIKTDFYITVNNGKEHVELDLPNVNVGAGNRYVINLIPY